MSSLKEIRRLQEWLTKQRGPTVLVQVGGRVAALPKYKIEEMLEELLKREEEEREFKV